MDRAQIAIMIGAKGRGSNMRAIIEASRAGEIPADVTTVVSSKDGTPAVLAARELGICVAVVEPGEDNGSRLLAAMAKADLLCLAGFLRLVPDEVVDRFQGNALNIHPSLLPKFGGKGMYGHFVHEAVLAAGETESGCTVHRVSTQYDEGEIVVQLRCAVEAGDTADTLAARVLKLEHQAYPEAIRRVLA